MHVILLVLSCCCCSILLITISKAHFGTNMWLGSSKPTYPWYSCNWALNIYLTFKIPTYAYSMAQASWKDYNKLLQILKDTRIILKTYSNWKAIGILQPQKGLFIHNTFQTEEWGSIRPHIHTTPYIGANHPFYAFDIGSLPPKP